MTTTAVYVSAAGISQPPSTSLRYIYGIVPTEESLIFETPGLGDAEVYTIACGKLAAVISATDRPDYRRLERQEAMGSLLAHQRVVEAVMDYLPVLPVKFGSVLASEAQVQTLLEQGAAQFTRALDVLQGAVQLEVLALWDLGRVFQLIGAEPEIVALKAEVAALPPSEAGEARVVVGKAVKAAFDRRRNEIYEALATPLRELAHDSIANLLMDDSMILNMALLVNEAERESLEQRLDELDELFGAGDEHFPPIQLRLVGPLPPYSFTSIEVLAPSYDEISAARALLGLGEQVEPAAIRLAYRRLAAQLHPDFNPDLPNAELQMNALTAAYRLLTAYADRRIQLTGDRAQLISFDPAAVEQTLLITVRRQDG